MEKVPCDLCGSQASSPKLCLPDLLLGASSEEFTLVECVSCGLMYLNPRPTSEELGRFYPQDYFGQSLPKARTGVERAVKRLGHRIKQWVREDYYGYPGVRPRTVWHRLRKGLLWPEYINRVIRGREFLPWRGKGRLLDVGCGTGVNLQVFQEQGWDVHGIEISPHAASQARAKVGERIHEGTLDDARFSQGAFDVIVLSHTLEHVLSPSNTLNQIHRLLDSKGCLVLAVPNAGGLEAKLFGRWWFCWELPRHLYHFRKATLSALLEKTGFKVFHQMTGLGSYFFMCSVERAIRQRLGLPLYGKKVIEKVVAKPLCLVAGHLGYGTELKVVAEKM